MKQLISLIICLILFSLFSCSEIDNYEAPDSHIEGKLVDATTGKLIPCQAPNGARIKMFEGTSTTPTTIWMRTDGTYKSDRVFSGAYTVVPEGPFIVKTTDTVKVAIPAGKNIDFSVEPYLRIDLPEVTLNGTTATLKFTISKSEQWASPLSQYVVLYSTTENIDVLGYIKRTQVTVNNSILGIQQTATIDNINTSRPIFVRVAARTGASSFYNYSVIKKL
jgi:hypothetical protein